MTRRHRDPIIADAIDAVGETWPYYLGAIDQLRIVADPNVDTMATSAAWVTHYNPATVAGWTRQQRAAVLVHELEHLLRRHHDRCGDRDPGRFNIAGDAEINQRIVGLPDGAVYPEALGQPRGRTAEVYYGATEPDQQPGGGESEGGDGAGSGSGASAPGAGAKCGSAAGGPVQDHETSDGINPGAGAADGGKAARQDAAASIIAHAPGQGTGAGDEMREWAEGELGIDRAAWYSALASVVGHTMQSYGAPTRWLWPGRRDARDMGGAMVPRWTGERPSVAVVIDTSGSVTPFDLEMARAAAHFIARAADATFYTCDYVPVNVGTTVPDRLRGGGGTDMEAGIAMAIREGARAVVVITDCMTPWDRTGPRSVPVIIGANPGAAGIIAGGPAGYYYPPEWYTVIPVVRPEADR